MTWKRLAIIVSLIALVAFAALLGISQLEKRTLVALFTEPSSYRRMPWYVGSLSTLVGIFWFSAGAIALFAASLSNRGRWSLLLFGCLSCWLGLDDLMSLHEYAIPRLVFGNDPSENTYASQRIIYGIYIGCTLLWLGLSWKFLKSRISLILLVSLACFSFSVGLDVATEWGYLKSLKKHQSFILWEDGSKLIGLMYWNVFAYLFSRGLVLESLKASEASERELDGSI